MHAAHYVQYKAIKKAFRIALPSETEFIAMLKNELAQINQHVEGCIGTMASVTPDASFLELSQCSAACGSLNTFIQHNRDGIRKIAKKYDKKVKTATGQSGMTAAQAQAQQLLDVAPFCTILLERTLDLQTQLEQWALGRQDGSELRRRLCAAYETSAGLLDEEAPPRRNMFSRPPVLAPAAPHMPETAIYPVYRCRSGEAAVAPMSCRVSIRAARRSQQPAPYAEIFHVPSPPSTVRAEALERGVPLFLLERSLEDL